MNNNTDSSAFSGDSIDKGVYNFKGKEGTDFAKYDFELNVLKKIAKGIVGTSSGKYYLLRMDKSAVSFNYRNEDSDIKCLINKKETLSHSFLSDKFSSDYFLDYIFCGLKEVSSDGSITDIYFDISKPIVSNITLCAVFQKKNEPSLDLSEITSAINNAASNATIEFFRGAPSGRDISKDPGYNKKENIVYLGSKSLKTTVKASATIKFCLNDGSENLEYQRKEKISFDPEDSAHDRQYTISLLNDLIINGELIIGGEHGIKDDSGELQGNINNRYVSKDFNIKKLYR